MTNPKHEIRDVLAKRRRHALLEGDCTQLLPRLPADSIDSCVTDPPYGMSYRGKDNKRPPIINDDRPFIWWLREAHRVVRVGGALICFCPWKLQESFRTAIEIAGFNVRSQVIWRRGIIGMGNTACTFTPTHDIVWFATKGRFRFPAGRPASVIDESAVPVRQRVHSTQKPITLMRKLITSVTPAGGVVLDPCAGSGSTGVAALEVGCRFIGIEIDPANVAVARTRLKAVRRLLTKLAARPHALRAAPVHYYPAA